MKIIPSTPLRTLAAGAIISALALSFASVCSANEDATPPQVIVKFADLDLSTPQGALALYGRIQSAADNVCLRVLSDAAYRLHKYACEQILIGDAVTRVNRPVLSAVFAYKHGMPQPAVLAAAATR
jgi:UrcA family protein